MKKIAPVIIIIALCLIILCGLSIWTDRNLDFVVSHFKGQPTDVPMWLSALATIILNALALAFNVACEIIRLVK